MKTSLTKILLVGNLLLLITAITLMAGCAYKEKQVVWESSETGVPSDTSMIKTRRVDNSWRIVTTLPVLVDIAINEVDVYLRDKRFIRKIRDSIFPADTSIVEIYDQGYNPNQPYQITGKVRSIIIGGPLNVGTEEKIKREIKPLASAMGADAIIGFYTSKQSIYEKMESGLWGSGLAVNWMSPPDSSSHYACPLMAAIRPWTFDSLYSKSNLRYWGIILDAAQYNLEKIGYYTLVHDVPFKPEDFAMLSEVKWNEDKSLVRIIDHLYGFETEYILLINEVPCCECKSDSNNSNNQYAIRAMLLSKLEEKIVWENCLPVDIDFRSRIFEGGRSRGDYDLDLVQYYKIMEKLFQDLPIPRIPHSPLEIITKDLMLLPRIPYAIAIQSKLEKYREDYSARYYREMSATARLAPNMLLYDAVSRDDTLGARRALELGADINFLGYNQNTPLHTAAIKAGPAMVNFLLQNGAKQDLHNESGLTPLEITEGKGNFVPRPEIASILREFKTR